MKIQVCLGPVLEASKSRNKALTSTGHLGRVFFLHHGTARLVLAWAGPEAHRDVIQAALKFTPQAKLDLSSRSSCLHILTAQITGGHLYALQSPPFLLQLQGHLGAALPQHHLILFTSQRPHSKSHHFFSSPQHMNSLEDIQKEATEVTKTSKCHQPQSKHCHQLCHHLVLLRSFESTSLSSPQTHHVTAVILPPKCDRLNTSPLSSAPTSLRPLLSSLSLLSHHPSSSPPLHQTPDLHPHQHCHQPQLILCRCNCRQHLHH